LQVNALGPVRVTWRCCRTARRKGKTVVGITSGLGSIA
jgi:hypothetical protein